MRNSTFQRPSLFLAGLSLCLLTLLPGCGTYHNVATWYKYRKDFHIPKEQQTQPQTQQAVARQTASKPEMAAPAPKAAAPAQEQAMALNSPAVEAAAKTAAEPTAGMSRKDIRKALRHIKRDSRLHTQEPAYASAGAAAPEVSNAPIWERTREAEQPVAAQAAKESGRPFSVAAIVGFIIAAVAFVGAVAFTSPLLFIISVIVALVLSIIGLTQTGSTKSHRGFGFAIAGLILSALILLAILLNND